MRSFTLVKFLTCFCLIALSGNSFAQENQTQPELNEASDKQQSKEENIFEIATDDQLQEAQQFYRKCEKNDTLKAQKNCKCAAAEYLKTRINLAPSATPRQIIAINRNTCLIETERYEISEDKPTIDFSNVTNKQLDEVEAVYQHCISKRSMGSQFNCECLSANFLDKRLELGPLVKWDAIFLRLRNQCRNVIETTGAEYTICMSRFGKVNAKYMEPKEYCECYARKWAELFENEQGGDLTHSRKKSMKSLARGLCIDEDRALR